MLGGVTYLLQVGQRVRRSPEAVVAVPAEDQDKTQEAEAEDKFVDKSEVLQFRIFWWGLKGQGNKVFYHLELFWSQYPWRTCRCLGNASQRTWAQGPSRRSWISGRTARGASPEIGIPNLSPRAWLVSNLMVYDYFQFWFLGHVPVCVCLCLHGLCNFLTTIVNLDARSFANPSVLWKKRHQRQHLLLNEIMQPLSVQVPRSHSQPWIRPVGTLLLGTFKKRLWRSIFFLLTFEFLCCLSKKIYLYMQSPKTFRFVHTPPSTTARSSGPTGHGWSLRSVQHFLQPERESSCNFWLFLMSSFLRASVGPAKLNPGFRPVQG